MISMKAIAKEAGVSRTTVSFVLNGRYKDDLKLSEPIVQKVLETADRLGYVRNKLVDCVVTGKSNVIAVLSHFGDYTIPTIKGCVEAAAEHNCIIKLIPLEKDINRALMQAVEFRVAGIFADSLQRSEMEQINPKFFRYGIPSYGLTPETHKIVFNQKESSCRGTEYLIRKGFRKIVFMGCYTEISRLREDGYREVMLKNGLEPRVLCCDMYPEEICRISHELIDLKPEAIQCANDSLALILLHECFIKNVRIPEAFAVLGFGNVPGSRFSAPTLSSVNEPYYETGRLHFQLIYDLICQKTEHRYEPLIGEVIERESTTSLQSINKYL